MLIKLLSDPDKEYLLKLAKLLALSDNPLLWDGKSSDQLTSGTDLNALSIQENELERELIADLEGSAGLNPFSNIFGRQSGLHHRLIEVLKTYPISKLESPEVRVQAATTVLKEQLKDKTFDLPSTPKIILYELFLVAIRDGHISNVEWALLKEFQHHYQLEDFIFEDLLERAESLNQEMSKTISLVLE